MKRSLLWVACVVFWCAACSDDDPVGQDNSPATGADAGVGLDGGKFNFAGFDNALQAAIEKYNTSRDGGLPIVGASAVVVTKQDGLVHTKGYGSFAADRLYMIASSGKILTAGVLLRLQDQGKLDINKPISDYLGSAWGAHKPGITTAQLLSNSSGLPSLAEISAAGANLTPEAIAQYSPHFCQYSGTGSLADCAKGIYQDDQPNNNRPPDKEFRYGGSQWQLAGAVAEQVSGKSWAQLIRETYVDACGASTLTFSNPYGPRADGSSALLYPPSFKGEAANIPATENPSIEGGASISAPDYAKLLLLHLREGKCGDTQVLSAAAVRTMQTDRISAYGGVPALAAGMPTLFTGYGMGWWTRADRIADPGAYGAYAFIDTQRGYGALIMLESSFTVGQQIAEATKSALDTVIDAAK